MMHWIDPDCMPETQGAVEGFIINRHGEIDGVLLTGARQTSLLVCTPPHMGAEIEAAIKIGEMIRVAVSGLAGQKSSLPWRSLQVTAIRSSITVPITKTSARCHTVTASRSGWMLKAWCGCHYLGQKASRGARCSKTTLSFG